MSAWKSTFPVVKAGVLVGAGFAAGGMLSILYFSDIDGAIDNFFNADEAEMKEVAPDTALITGGDISWVVYKGVSCPLIKNWPDEKELMIGSTGEASLSPNEEIETTAVTTILGALGVTSDVRAKDNLTPNAQLIMADFYEHARACNEQIISLQESPDIPRMAP